MANLITAGLAYDPYFYASAALTQLNKRLGMAAFVTRAYEAEKGMEKGSTIRLRRPGKFVAQAMPIPEANAQDVVPEYMDVTLSNWFGDVMGLTDKELSYTKEQIINEHIDPLAIAIADKIDQSLQSLGLECPWSLAADGTTPVNDFSNIQEQLFLHLAPRQGDYYYQLDNVLQKRYQQQAVFYQANTGVDSETLQRDGFLGRKFGFTMYANQNEPSYVTGTIALTSPIVSGLQTKGSTTLVISGSTGSGTARAGTIITITGDAQKYSITADVAVGGTGFTASISPALQQDAPNSTVVSFDQTASTTIGLAFHRQAFALVMAPLSTVGNGLGIRMATMSDPITGLTLRTRLWASGGSAKVFVGIDALWGVKTLNPNLAVRVRI